MTILLVTSFAIAAVLAGDAKCDRRSARPRWPRSLRVGGGSSPAKPTTVHRIGDCTPTSIDHAAVCILFSCLRYFSISSRVATP